MGCCVSWGGFLFAELFKRLHLFSVKRLFVQHFLVLCLCGFQCRVVWVRVLYCRAQGKRLCQVIYLYPAYKKDFYVGAVYSLFIYVFDVLCGFYAITHIVFGPASFIEFCIVLARFYVCFVLFSSLALLLTLIPLSFQNTNTLFSIVSFAMLVVGVAGANSSLPLATVVSFFNPLWWANRVMADGVAQMGVLVALIVVLYITVFLISVRYLLVTPVWSRY